MSSWIQTFSGRAFDPLNPRPEDISIVDIAHALSLTCRFGGQCSQFYSVAEHSIYVALFAPKTLGREALLHDATEAYLTDIPRPIKRHLNDFRALENSLEKVIAEKFNLLHPLPPIIHEIDYRMLFTEKRQLFANDLQWENEVEPYDLKITPREPRIMKGVFLKIWEQLGGVIP